MSITGTVYNIQQFSIHDGPGIRTTVFLKGCPLTCWWCHNPESRSPEIVRVNGTTIGKRYSPDELMDILKKDIIFYDQSNGGVTFSGGEPMEQTGFLLEMLRRCKENGIQTAIDTSGYADQETFEKVIPYTDLFLFDLKLMDACQHLHYTSVDNKGIFSNLEYLINNDCLVIVRIPLIPEITNSIKNLEQLLTWLSEFSNPPEVNLLPYHRTAEGKYEKLGMVNRMKGSKELTAEEIDQSLELFRSKGYPVSLG